MRRKICLVILVCLMCSGCKTSESFWRKNELIPVITATSKEVETEAVWVPAKTRKVWVNPNIDDEGDMIDGHYKYVILEKGHWALQEITPEAKSVFNQAKPDESVENER